MQNTLHPTPVGMVIGSRDATALDFWVAVSDGQYLRLDDLVYVHFAHPEPQVGTVTYYGMVDQVVKLYEGSLFDTDVFLASEAKLPISLSYAAHVKVTRLEPEEYLPPDPGSPVYSVRQQPAELARALYYDKMVRFDSGLQQEVSTQLPVGLLKNGEVAYVNLEFLNGVKGGHVNISGISGVATKTSYATFLLHALLHAPSNPEAANTRALVFNVKGEDLFYLDKPNKRLLPEQSQMYKRLGLPATPFQSVAFRAPPKKTPGDLVPDISRQSGVSPYYWDLVQFCREGLLPYLFTDRGALSNLGFLIDQVTERLRKLVGDGKSAQRGPHLLVEDWNAGSGVEGGWDSLGKTALREFADLAKYIEFQLLGPENQDDDGQKPKGNSQWTARQASATLEAFVRRLKAAIPNVQHLIRGDKPGNPPNPLSAEAQLHVIDIHQLHSQAQMFVVGALLRDVFARKEDQSHRGRIFIVLDELNKYAPREDEGPIKDILLDIAERGRSLGVILIGAQQTASEVERRVVGNAAIRVVGRLDAAESERPEYRYLPPSFRERAVILPQGTMIVQQPELPVPLPIVFPFPAWATKAEEEHQDNSDQALKEERLFD